MTGAKSLRGSKVTLNTCGALATWSGPISTVYPSGALWAAASKPTLPLAPDLFSTTSSCPRKRDKLSAIARAPTSVEPPAGYGTMKRMGRLGHSCAAAAAGIARATKSDAINAGERAIPSLLPFASVIYYRNDAGSVEPIAASRLEVLPRNAVLDLSARRHGSNQALSLRAIRCGLICRADPDLYGRRIWHRRHRNAQNLMADDIRHEQAAIRAAIRGEFHHGRGEQWGKARGLVRPAQHPALCKHAPHSCRPRLSACRRHAHDPDGRPATRLARVSPADQLRRGVWAQDRGRCFCHV